MIFWQVRFNIIEASDYLLSLDHVNISISYTFESKIKFYDAYKDYIINTAVELKNKTNLFKIMTCKANKDEFLSNDKYTLDQIRYLINFQQVTLEVILNKYTKLQEIYENNYETWRPRSYKIKHSRYPIDYNFPIEKEKLLDNIFDIVANSYNPENKDSKNDEYLF
jgi:hypothetical protein